MKKLKLKFIFIFIFYIKTLLKQFCDRHFLKTSIDTSNVYRGQQFCENYVSRQNVCS